MEVNYILPMPGIDEGHSPNAAWFFSLYMSESSGFLLPINNNNGARYE